MRLVYLPSTTNMNKNRKDRVLIFYLHKSRVCINIGGKNAINCVHAF